MHAESYYGSKQNPMQLSWDGVYNRARLIVNKLNLDEIKLRFNLSNASTLNIYGIPRGGIFAVQAFYTALHDWLTSQFYTGSLRVVECPSAAHILVDDIVDSGTTMNRYLALATLGGKQAEPLFLALVNKLSEDDESLPWISFPWERAMGESTGIEDNIVRLLEYIGEDPMREGLKETPARVARAYGEMFSGYKVDPASVFKVFQDGACDEMVLLKDIQFTSFCEHHMLPFVGTATIGYIPNGLIIGVSKLARLLEIYSKRLQVQERLTVQITNDLERYLAPKGAACLIKAQHLCMSCRGVNKTGSTMVTSSLTGAFRIDHQTRSEFMQLATG